MTVVKQLTSFGGFLCVRFPICYVLFDKSVNCLFPYN